MTPKKRHKSRILVMQALYQWQLADTSVNQLKQQFHKSNDVSKFDEAYFSRLLQGVLQRLEDIDQALSEVMDRPKEALNPIELAVLRLASYELMDCLEIPYRVVINEALEVTKQYGTVEGFKYVNAVLDKIALKLRPDR